MRAPGLVEARNPDRLVYLWHRTARVHHAVIGNKTFLNRIEIPKKKIGDNVYVFIVLLFASQSV